MNASDLSQVLDGIGAHYCLQLTQALLHFLWQGAVIAIAYAAAARGLRRASAGARYVAGVAAMLMMVVCLSATLFVLPSSHPAAARAVKQPGAAWMSSPTPPADAVSRQTSIRRPAADRAASLLLDKYKNRIPPGRLEEVRKTLIRQKLKSLVEIKLICQEAKCAIPAEAWASVEQSVGKHFDNVEQEKLMKKAGAGTPREFDQKLRALGTSLEQEKREFVERKLAQQWLQQKIKPDRESPAKASREPQDDVQKKIIQERMQKHFREYMAELEARTPVWTIFDVDASKSQIATPPQR